MPSFQIQPQQILDAATDKTKIIFLCSPGNPTANCLRFSDIEAILTAKVGSYFRFLLSSLSKVVTRFIVVQGLRGRR